MELSKRLQAVADMVTAGRNVADVGCDHGYVSIYLMQRRIANRVYAMDVNRGPLERAAEHVAEAGLSEKISIRLSDGANALSAGEADCMVVAGMGGRLMTRILSDAAERNLVFEELVLQPQSEPFKVRQYLWENGYYIADEKMVFEDGKYYQIIKALRGREIELEQAEQLTYEAYACYGKVLLQKQDNVAMDYLAFELLKCDEIYQHILEKQTRAQTDTLLALEQKRKVIAHAQRIGESYGKN